MSEQSVLEQHLESPEGSNSRSGQEVLDVIQPEDADISDALAELDNDLVVEEPEPEPEPPIELERETEPEPEPETVTEEAPEPDPTTTTEERSDALAETQEQLRQLRAELEALRNPSATEESQVPAARDIEAQRQEAHSFLQSHYALSQDDADLMLTQPEAVVPKFAAHLHTSVVESVVRMLPEVLPVLLDRLEQKKAVEDSFYSAVEAVDPRLAEHRARVAEIRPVFERLHPGLEAQELAQKMGQALIPMLGLANSTQESTPSPAPTRSRAAPPPPAAARGGTGTAPPVKETNFFTDVAEEDLAQQT